MSWKWTFVNRNWEPEFYSGEEMNNLGAAALNITYLSPPPKDFPLTPSHINAFVAGMQSHHKIAKNFSDWLLRLHQRKLNCKIRSKIFYCAALLMSWGAGPVKVHKWLNTLYQICSTRNIVFFSYFGCLSHRHLVRLKFIQLLFT